jgi:hypothetical protein
VLVRNRLATRMLLLVCTTAAACGGNAPPTGAGGSSPPVSNSPAPSISPTRNVERIGLSLNDHGRVIAVRTSSQITLVLSDKYRWTDPTTQGTALDVLALESDAPEGGQVWELVPGDSGRTIVRSVGSPACRPTTPGCPKSDRNYIVTLDISD